MLDILYEPVEVERGRLANPKMYRLLGQQQEILRKLVDYHRTDPKPVQVTSPILRLIYQFDWPASQSAMDYYNRAQASVHEIAGPLRITTSIQRGDVYKGIFFGDEVLTNLVYSNFYPAADLLTMPEDGWKDMAPLRVVAYPGIAGSFARPDKGRCGPGIAVVMVDIPALAFMWHHWMQQNLAKDAIYQERPDMFLARYLYPNMLWSVNDCIIMNSIQLTTEEIETQFDPQKPPIGTADYMLELLITTNRHVDELARLDYSLPQFMRQIPMMSSGTLWDFYPLLQDNDTEANYWSQLTIGVRYVYGALLCTLNNPNGSTVRNRMRRISRRVEGENTIAKVPDKAFSQYLEDAYNECVRVIVDVYQ